MPLSLPRSESSSSVTNGMHMPELLLGIIKVTSGIASAMLELCLEVKRSSCGAMLPLEVIELTSGITNAMMWDFDKELTNTLPYHVSAACPQVLPMCLPDSGEGS